MCVCVYKCIYMYLCTYSSTKNCNCILLDVYILYIDVACLRNFSEALPSFGTGHAACHAAVACATGSSVESQRSATGPQLGVTFTFHSWMG